MICRLLPMRIGPMRTGLLAVPVLVLAMLGCAKADGIAAACQSPGWDMSRELVAFRGPARAARAGANAADLPTIELGRLYALQLQPQSTVQFVQPPQKPARVQGPTAGLARFSVRTGGKYRITVDAPLWIDVVAPAGIVQSSDFNGWHACALFRKSVEYTLQAGRPFVLQLSGASAAAVKVAIEPLQQSGRPAAGDAAPAP